MALVDSLITVIDSASVENEPRPPTSPSPRRSITTSEPTDKILSESEPTLVAAPTPQRPTHRLRIRGDGRCAVRATLAAAQIPPPPGVENIATDASPAALEYLRDIRADACEALVKKMAEDPDLDCAVRWSFPDESYDSFEEWLAAQQSDDSTSASSSLWHGGGSWVLYGLALLFELKIVVHVLESETLTLSGPPQGTELVDARAASASSASSASSAEDDAAVAHLASLRDEDGSYDHFDVLLFEARQGAETLLRPPQNAPRFASTSTARPAPSTSRLLGWAALNVLLVSLYLQASPSTTEGASQLFQRIGEQLAQYLQARGAEFDPSAAMHGAALLPTLPPVEAAMPHIQMGPPIEEVPLGQMVAAY